MNRDGVGGGGWRKTIQAILYRIVITQSQKHILCRDFVTWMEMGDVNCMEGLSTEILNYKKVLGDCELLENYNRCWFFVTP